MHVAICMTSQIGSLALLDCIKAYESPSSNALLYTIYHNNIDFLDALTPGRYDALFFDQSLKSHQLNEIQQLDQQIRLISLVADDMQCSCICTGVWSFLSNPPELLFVHSVLDRLYQEAPHQSMRNLVLNNRGSLSVIAFSNIEYVEVQRRTIVFHLIDGTREETVGTFAHYEKYLLELPIFAKAHRSYIVNLHHIQKLTREGIVTKSGAFVPVSEIRYPQFKKDFMSDLLFLPQIEACATTHPTQTAPHVLLLDSDAAALQHWGDILTAHTCTIDAVQTRETALYLLQRKHFDCVILEAQLGQESGFDIHQAIKAITSAPVLYLSAIADFAYQIRAFQLGAADYITKDTNAELFWLKVDSRIQTGKVSACQIIAGPLALQLKDRTAMLCNQPLFLTAVEFNLLHFFMQHPNTIFTPAELYQHIWGNDNCDAGQAIQIHLSGLHIKLTQIFSAHRYIEVVWNKGYRFLPCDASLI